MNQLPDLLLIFIFKYLSASQCIEIEMVCQKWKALSQSTWTKFHLIIILCVGNSDSLISANKVNVYKFMTLLICHWVP